jgi:hypothetical protein
VKYRGLKEFGLVMAENFIVVGSEFKRNYVVLKHRSENYGCQFRRI